MRGKRWTIDRDLIGRLAFLGLGVGAVLSPERAHADDDMPFAWVYPAETGAKGELEVEQWLTFSSNKTQEAYDALAGRTEVEYGAIDRLSLAVYANYAWTRTVPYGPAAPDTRSEASRFSGFSGEAIYQLLDPAADPIGLALYLEPGIQAGERSVEFKLLLQRDLFDNRLVIAANANLEYVWSHAESGGWEQVSALEFLLGLAYRFAPDWSAGFELVNENAYSGHLLAGARAETRAFYLGPTIHYGHDGWWATVGLSQQLPWAGNPGRTPGGTTHGYVTDAERFRLRLRLGFEL
ncbi:MAG TPA: DUF6662 family protein [Micropepsaceae bacterium]|nr:DUF6662 family protein [Micropepsaceae bacterium]